MAARGIATVTLVVPDYAAGIAFFCEGLGWDLLADEDQGRKRWVVVAPNGGASGARLLLARADSPPQRAAIGGQTGGRVAFFLETDDFDRDAARLRLAGARFLEAPRDEPYGRVAQWQDPLGNLWDLLAPAPRDTGAV
ncbi:MAG: VOC family protein [Pseudomonadota bacterium]